MIDKLNADQVGHLVGKAAAPNPEAADKRAPNDTDVTCQVSFADLINQARESATADAAAVEQAKALLLSGQLTSPENIRSAAESILRFGV